MGNLILTGPVDQSEHIAPYAAFVEATLSPALFGKVTGLPLLAVLVTFLSIISMSPMTSVMTKLDPVIKKLLCITNEAIGSLNHLQ